ncbi:MAG: tetratricopeptide repeat protein [Myxococcales bacterium]|nr:tetratricopeptide repeat protein [Myxococcota bacterium]MDW8280150.1 tetratricopeptide repeat protein [Myxococcales bacterium]
MTSRAAPGGEDPFEAGLQLFRAQRFAAAAVALEQARAQRPHDPDVLLLLGIALYRQGNFRRAIPLLQEVARAGPPDLQATARLFLGLALQALGAMDEAHRELNRAARGDVGTAGRALARRLQPQRLSASLLLSPEVDGNVPLSDATAWSLRPEDSVDGDLLVQGTVSLRPLRHLGLSVGNTTLYRQQMRLHRFSLLLQSSWAAYSYLGLNHRVRALAALTYALMGGNMLYLEGEGRAWYRARLWSELGLSLSYALRYRDYRQTEFLPFSGHTHTAQVELQWGLSPEPITASLGYLAQREELKPGQQKTDDFRAWAHGPLLRVRGRLHGRLELLASGGVLLRVFDLLPAHQGLRGDIQLQGDVSMSVDCTRWLEVFAGASILYNHSTDPAFTWIKPVGYLGLGGHLSTW